MLDLCDSNLSWSKQPLASRKLAIRALEYMVLRAQFCENGWKAERLLDSKQREAKRGRTKGELALVKPRSARKRPVVEMSSEEEEEEEEEVDEARAAREECFDKYTHELRNFRRHGQFSPSQLDVLSNLIPEWKPIGSKNKNTPSILSYFVGVDGITLPDVQEWRAICRTARSICKELLDPACKTWRSQREDAKKLAIRVFEQSVPLARLCDESSYKARLVLERKMIEWLREKRRVKQAKRERPPAKKAKIHAKAIVVVESDSDEDSSEEEQGEQHGESSLEEEEEPAVDPVELLKMPSPRQRKRPQPPVHVVRPLLHVATR